MLPTSFSAAATAAFTPTTVRQSVLASTADEAEPCASLTDADYRLWCASLRAPPTTTANAKRLSGLTYQDAGLRNRTWASYRGALRRCLWRQPPQGDAHIGLWHATSNMLPTNVSANVGSSYCETQTADGSSWRVLRIAPVWSAGSYSPPHGKWINVLVHRAFNLGPIPTYITALMTSTTDAEHRLLGFPPLRVHHSHLMPHSGYIADSMMLNHQDSACAPSEGGLECFLTSLEHGYGLRTAEPLDFIGMYEDVRPHESARIEWGVEIAVRVARRSQSAHLRPLSLFRYDYFNGVLQPPFYAFRVPASQWVVHYQTTVVPLSGRLHSLWIHSHVSRGTIETWLVDGDTQTLGLGPSVSANSSVSALGDDDDAVRRFRAGVLHAMERHQLRMRCIARRHASWQPSWGDVQPQWVCYEGAELLVEGQSLTHISFFYGPSDGIVNAQHIHLQGHVSGAGVGDFTTIYGRNTAYIALDPSASVWNTTTSSYAHVWPVLDPLWRRYWALPRRFGNSLLTARTMLGKPTPVPEGGSANETVYW